MFRLIDVNELYVYKYMYFRDWNRFFERSDKRNYVVDNDIIVNLWCECMN